MIVFADSSSFVNPASLSEVEREIYEGKRASPVTYRYATAGSLLFELRLRRNLLESSRMLNRSGARFADFARSVCNPAYWKLTNKGGFQLRPGTAPAAAIRDIYANGSLYAFECATAVLIVLYRGVLATIGDEAFNRSFGNLLLYDWHFDEDLGLRQTTIVDRLYPGDVVYFINPDVSPATPWWMGENALKLEGELFYGHGAGITDAEGIIRVLNRNRKPGAVQSARLTNTVVTPNYAHLERLATPSYWNSPAWPRNPDLLHIRIGQRSYTRILRPDIA